MIAAMVLAAVVTGEESRPPDLNGIWQAIGTAHWDLERGDGIAPCRVATQIALPIAGGMRVVEQGAQFVQSLRVLRADAFQIRLLLRAR